MNSLNLGFRSGEQLGQALRSIESEITCVLTSYHISEKTLEAFEEYDFQTRELTARPSKTGGVDIVLFYC